MDVRDAIDQISAIRTQLARTERLKSLRAVPVALSGALALLAAGAQSLWIQEPATEPVRYLLLWVGAAAISGLAASMEVARRAHASRSELGVANVRLAVEQFAPCTVAGAIVTAVIALRHAELLWLLPGLWQLLFGLGNLAAHRLLPSPAFAIGAFYLITGSICLLLGDGALQPWAMGLPFAGGQGALAAILWWQQERPVGPAATEHLR